MHFPNWFAIVWLLPAIALPQSPGAQPIQAVAHVEKRTLCPGDDETFAVNLKLRLRFTNHSNQKLIVFKHTGDEWYEVRVAESPSDLVSGKYEYNPNIDWFSDSPRAPNDADIQTKFSVLAPGESFENHSTVSVVASFRVDHSVVGTVKPGEHVLQLQMSTWNYLDGPDKTRQDGSGTVI